MSRDGRALVAVVSLGGDFCRLLFASSFTHATRAIRITHLVLASRGAQKLRHGKERRHWLALEVQKGGRSLCYSPFLWYRGCSVLTLGLLCRKADL